LFINSGNINYNKFFFIIVGFNDQVYLIYRANK